MSAEPSRQSPAVTSLDAHDTPAAARVLGRAFSEDPLWSVLIPDLELRVRMFTGVLKMITAAGGVVETTAGLGAAALWLPPGRELGFAAVVRSGIAPALWVLRAPRATRRRLTALQRQVDRRRKELMPEPHWQLMVLGVDPDHHGRGMGSALVTAGVERADASRAPIYVDTSAEANVGFYGQFGFEVVEEMTVTDLALPFWMMVHRPAPFS